MFSWQGRNVIVVLIASLGDEQFITLPCLNFFFCALYSSQQWFTVITTLGRVQAYCGSDMYGWFTWSRIINLQAFNIQRLKLFLKPIISPW